MSAITLQANLIKQEIDKQLTEAKARINDPSLDLHMQCQRFLSLPPIPVMSISALFPQIKAQITLLKIEFETTKQEPKGLQELTSIYAIANKAIDDFNIARSQKGREHTVEKLCERLSDSLPFSLSIVGIVVRYAI